jgi:hypothetical protein
MFRLTAPSNPQITGNNDMNSSQTDRRAGRMRDLFAPNPSRMPVTANWRQGVAMMGGFLVLLVTAWLVWAALAEAALARAQFA